MSGKEESLSAVILAGGLSTRMGTCKAELPWEGKTLLQHQVERMRSLGIEDIILAGYAKPVEGTRCVPDRYPRKGPLGGIHAGLLAARNGSCLVTGIDTPLVPAEIYSELVRTHRQSEHRITVLGRGGELEPLMGVYDRYLAGIAEEILQGDSTSVRRLLDRSGYEVFPYMGDEVLLRDCNTPEDLRRALEDRDLRRL